MVDHGQKVTVESFRNSLAQRGVHDLATQNKVLNLVLQNKAGLHYAMGRIINGLVMDNNCPLLMNADGYTIELEVNSANSIDLIFKAQWENYLVEPRQPSIEANVTINITPNNAAITDFTLTKLVNSEVANSAFKFLQDNQQNILMRLITYIRHALGFNSELTIENSTNNVQDWVNTPKI